MAMTNGTERRDAEPLWRRLWNNYVVRNVVLAVSLLVIGLFLVNVLLNIFTRHNKYIEVPDLEELTLDEARQLIRRKDMRIEVDYSLYVAALDPGTVLEQQPAAGTRVKPGRRIYVTVNATQQRIVDVPYVAGYSLRQAWNILATAGFRIERLEYVSDIATNNVLEQRVGSRRVTPEHPVQARMGSGVVLVLGRAADAARVTVPRVVGLTLREAESRIWDAGLNVGGIEQDEGIDQKTIRQARVWRQTPDQGSMASLGSRVTLALTLDSARLSKGVSSSDRQAVQAARHAVRERVVRDSLAAAGFSGEQLQFETEWQLKIERGEATPEERAAAEAELIMQSLENYGTAVDASEEEDEFFH